MDLEQQLGAALAPCRPAPALRAAVLARIAPTTRPASAVRRGGRHTILFGTVLAIAAAAGMLIIQLQEKQPMVAVIPPAQSASTALIEPVAGAADTLRADTDKSEAGEPRILAARPSQTFTVQVLPLGLAGDDPVALTALNEFYATAVKELAAVPGLVLLETGDAAATADYRIRFNGGIDETAALPARAREMGQAQPVTAATRTWRMQLTVESRRAPVRTSHDVDAAPGTRTLTMVDGQAVASASGQADAVHLDIIPSNLLQRMEVVTGGSSSTYGSGAMSGEVNLVLDRRLEGVDLDVDYGVNEAGVRMYQAGAVDLQQPDGYRLVYAQTVLGSPTRDLAGLATTEIERLRMAVFPVDAALSARLRARVLDASQSYDRRLAALQLLAGQEDGTANPETIRGALALLGAATDAPARAMVWRLLRGKPHPAMLRPLLDMLGTARDAALRLEILTTLAAGYKDSPAALAALKSSAADDPDALVRNVALRGISGDAAWREYAATIIGDARLTPAERFAPLAYLYDAEQGQDVRNLLDEQTLQALVTVLPPLLEDARHRSGANMLLGELHTVNNPLVANIVLASLDHGVETYSTRSILVDLLGRYRDDPRARQRLEELAAGDADQKVRALAGALLRMPTTQGR